MDSNVIAAMARWPGVPDVYGWLSLSERGRWRLHPGGTALLDPQGTGEEISSPQILRFIGRNYACDERGRWYFQNGPQRVYVRLDAAPYVFSCAGPGPDLRSHDGLPAGPVQAWWLDDGGRLYASCRLGPGLIAGRDLMDVMDGLYTEDGRPLLQALEQDEPGAQPLQVCAEAAPGTKPGTTSDTRSDITPNTTPNTTPDTASGVRATAGAAGSCLGDAGSGMGAAPARLVPLRRCAARDIPAMLGFERLPQP
jgi:hypothetical protein